MRSNAKMVEPVLPPGKPRISDLPFTWAMIGACTLLLTGAYLDGWAHGHIPQLETFFTPWHGVLYAGFFVITILTVGTVGIRRLRGYSWREALSRDYGWYLVGIIGFVIGGIGDLIWHTLFGIEKGIDATLSPTHILLMFAAGSLIAGPFRAAWHWSPTDPSPSLAVRLLPIPALTLLLTYLSHVTDLAHPFVVFWPTNTPQTMGNQQLLAVVSFLFQTLVLMGPILLTLRKWRWPFGSFTFLLTVNAIALSFIGDHFIVILMAAGAGITTDLLYGLLQPSITRLLALRIFAFAMPVIFFLVYFVTLWLTQGIVWSIHLSLGSILAPGIVGWLLSYLLVPASILHEKSREQS